MQQGIDLIGDVHGQATLLERLLHQLDYRLSAGVWRHPERLAVFVGDLIDRGPEQVRALETVRRMCEEGAARCVMGNHEHNAIGWLLPDLKMPGGFLREHTDAHRRHHAAFLTEVEERPALHQDLVQWMKRLPMVLDIEGIRVAHACWDERHVERVRAVCHADGSLTEEGLRASLTRGTELHASCEAVLKGPEAALPAGIRYVDPCGKEREQVRLAWWSESRRYREAALPMPGLAVSELPDAGIDAGQYPRIDAGALHVFGHYWMRAPLRTLAGNLVCVDFTGMAGQPLTAYRWQGEKTFDARNFVQAH